MIQLLSYVFTVKKYVHTVTNISLLSLILVHRSRKKKFCAIFRLFDSVLLKPGKQSRRFSLFSLFLTHFMLFQHFFASHEHVKFQILISLKVLQKRCKQLGGLFDFVLMDFIKVTHAMLVCGVFVYHLLHDI